MGKSDKKRPKPEPSETVPLKGEDSGGEDVEMPVAPRAKIARLHERVTKLGADRTTVLEHLQRIKSSFRDMTPVAFQAEIDAIERKAKDLAQEKASITEDSQRFREELEALAEDHCRKTMEELNRIEEILRGIRPESLLSEIASCEAVLGRVEDGEAKRDCAHAANAELVKYWDDVFDDFVKD